MNGTYNKLEHKWVGLVKEQMCSVCGASGPSEAHHIIQHDHFTTVALCISCHKGHKMGWHGQRVAWHLAKMEEIHALNVTIQNVFKHLQNR